LLSAPAANGRVGQWRGPGFDDADVSIVPPIIPDSGFSPVRLEGRYIRQCLPVDREFFATCGLPSALRAPRCLYRRIPDLSRGTRCACAPPFKRPLPLYPRGPRSGPGYAVPVHHHLSTPCAPLTGAPRFHRYGLYEVPSLCVDLRRLGNQ